MSDSKINSDRFTGWHSAYMGYFKENKKKFDNLLETARKNRAYFNSDEAKQHIEKMGEMREENISPYKLLLDQNGINAGTVAKTKSKSQEQLLKGLQEMQNADKVLRDLAQEINKFRT